MQVWIVEERAPRGGWRSEAALGSVCFSSEQQAADALLAALNGGVYGSRFTHVLPSGIRKTELGTCYAAKYSGGRYDKWRIRSLELK